MRRRALSVITLLLVCFPLVRESAVGLEPNHDAEAGRIILSNFPPNDYDSSDAVIAVAQGKDGAIYVGTPEGVSRYDGNTWVFSPSPLRPVTRLVARPDNTIGLTNGSQWAVLRHDLVRGTSISLENTPAAPSPPGREAVYPDKNGDLSLQLSTGQWVRAKHLGGVSIALGDGLKWLINPMRGLGGQKINCLLEDRDHGLWIGTDQGVSRVDLNSPYTLYFRRDGLERSPVRALTRRGERLLVAQNRGVYELQPASKEPTGVALFHPLKLGRLQPSDIQATPEGHLLIASAVGSQTGLHIQWAGTGKLETVTHQPVLSLSPAPIHGQVIAIGQGMLGWLKIEGDHWSWKTVSCPLAGPNATMARQDNKALWLANGTGGWARLNPSNNGWPHATVHRLAMPDEEVAPGTSFILQHRDDILFLNEAGAFHLDETGERFIPDARGKFWAGGDERPVAGRLMANGRLWLQLHSKLNPRQYRLVCLDQAGHLVTAVSDEILAAIHFGQTSHLYIDNFRGHDFLWVTGAAGLLRCDLASLGRSPPLPPAPLVRLVDTPPLAEDYNGTGSLRFKAYRGSLRIVYALPDFTPGARGSFQTKSPGSNDWSPPSIRNESSLVNITSGPHRWAVRAVDATGRPGPATEINFSVVPPWRRTWPAYLLWIATLTGSVVVIVRWRLAHSERERTRLEALVQERTAAWQEAAHQAEAATAAKSTFLANASHELRTPLNAILGYAALLEQKAHPATVEPLGIIHRSGTHLLSLINHLLDLSKLESGTTAIRAEPIDLHATLEEIVSTHRIAAKAKGLALNLGWDVQGPARVLGDALRLRQIFDNLISNAVNFTATGRVTLKVRCADRDETTDAPESNRTRLEFTVEDTGRGIAPEDRERIFEPFQQSRHEQLTNRGTGLGLALTKHLVALLGGNLAVHSHPGKGSCFSFVLPMTIAPKGEPAETNLPSRIIGYEGPPRHLLVIDDVETNRTLVRDQLTPLGFNIAEAESGVEMTAQLATRIPDAIILDYRLRGETALDLLRQLRSDPNHAQVPVIVTSASVDIAEQADLAATGCAGFLPKPYAEVELLDLLASTLHIQWRTTVTPDADAGHSETVDIETATLEFLLADARLGKIIPVREKLNTLGQTNPGPMARELIELAGDHRLGRLEIRLTEILAQQRTSQ